jgi:hypothetical protein
MSPIDALAEIEREAFHTILTLRAPPNRKFGPPTRSVKSEHRRRLEPCRSLPAESLREHACSLAQAPMALRQWSPNPSLAAREAARAHKRVSPVPGDADRRTNGWVRSGKIELGEVATANPLAVEASAGWSRRSVAFSVAMIATSLRFSGCPCQVSPFAFGLPPGFSDPRRPDRLVTRSWYSCADPSYGFE